MAGEKPELTPEEEWIAQIGTETGAPAHDLSGAQGSLRKDEEGNFLFRNLRISDEQAASIIGNTIDRMLGKRESEVRPPEGTGR